MHIILLTTYSNDIILDLWIVAKRISDLFIIFTNKCPLRQ